MKTVSLELPLWKPKKTGARKYSFIVVNISCSFRGPFNSQHLGGHSQWSVTPVPGDLTSSSDFCDTRHVPGTQANIDINNMKINKILRGKQLKLGWLNSFGYSIECPITSKDVISFKMKDTWEDPCVEGLICLSGLIEILWFTVTLFAYDSLITTIAY